MIRYFDIGQGLKAPRYHGRWRDCLLLFLSTSQLTARNGKAHVNSRIYYPTGRKAWSRLNSSPFARFRSVRPNHSPRYRFDILHCEQSITIKVVCVNNQRCITCNFSLYKIYIILRAHYKYIFVIINYNFFFLLVFSIDKKTDLKMPRLVREVPLKCRNIAKMSRTFSRRRRLNYPVSDESVVVSACASFRRKVWSSSPPSSLDEDAFARKKCP